MGLFSTYLENMQSLQFQLMKNNSSLFASVPGTEVPT